MHAVSLPACSSLYIRTQSQSQTDMIFVAIEDARCTALPGRIAFRPWPSWAVHKHSWRIQHCNKSSAHTLKQTAVREKPERCRRLERCPSVSVLGSPNRSRRLQGFTKTSFGPSEFSNLVWTGLAWSGLALRDFLI